MVIDNPYKNRKVVNLGVFKSKHVKIISIQVLLSYPFHTMDKLLSTQIKPFFVFYLVHNQSKPSTPFHNIFEFFLNFVFKKKKDFQYCFSRVNALQIP